ncbi:MAG TPA: M48 family metallopeptidase [Lysobacter sp.]|nr:M48 family metallopeptidase [Lysobacter sp.]
MRHWMSFRTITFLLLAGASGLVAAAGTPAEMPAVVHKGSVDVHSGPAFDTAKVATLSRNAAVRIIAQQGLWYRLELGAGKTGYVRINDVRMAYAGNEAPAANTQALFTGNAGKGRVTETASVRGINESSLQRAGYDSAGMTRLQNHRVDPATATAYARSQGWQAKKINWAGEASVASVGNRPQATQAEKRKGLSSARGLLSKLGAGAIGDNAMRVADRAVGKSEQELLAEELELGPAIAGRVLGAAPLWADDEAQKRVNLVGRWVASQTARPDLPWTFGIIDDGEVNAFAAPGGYILMTRGLYDLLADDAEIAAVIAHELGHVVQRDHYEVIRKQEVARVGKDIAMAQVRAPGAASYAKDYVSRHGATVLMSSLDRDAEYRADQAAGIYLARSGFDPLAFYAVLQKMTALGTRSARLTQMYRTHPPLDHRLDQLDRQARR